jgi:hypothetical protein
MRIILALITGCLVFQGVYAQNPTGLLVPPDSLVKDTSGQRDLIGIALQITHIHVKKPPTVRGKRVYYSLLPLSTSVPGGGNALVTATTIGFYLGDRKTTYLSNIVFSPSTNFKGAFNIPFRSNIWAPNNSWNYSGDTRLAFIPQFIWGLGGKQPEDRKILIHYAYIRVYQNALKRIKPYLFAGVGYNLDYHFNIRPVVDTASSIVLQNIPMGPPIIQIRCLRGSR